jgi:putative transcriptional regulator
MHQPTQPNACAHQRLLVEQALVGLDAARLDDLRAHLLHCAACNAQQAQLSQVLVEQVEALEPVRPAPSVWQRLEARLAAQPEVLAAEKSDSLGATPRAPEAQPWKRWSSSPSGAPRRALPWPGLHIQRADPAAWQTTAFTGVEVQPLSVSAEMRQATMLVRMAPGSSYPPHRHSGPEECYVLAGDLWVGDDVELKPGDFQRAEADSVHAVQSTRGGCLLLIQTSLDDELLG